MLEICLTEKCFKSRLHSIINITLSKIFDPGSQCIQNQEGPYQSKSSTQYEPWTLDDAMIDFT